MAVMSAQFATVNQIREDTKSTLREAFDHFKSLNLNDYSNNYVLLFHTIKDKNHCEITELIFQSTDLKWDACARITTTLQERGIINF